MGTIQDPTPGPRRTDGELPLDITRPNRKAIASSVEAAKAKRAAEADERARQRAAEVHTPEVHRDSVDVSPAAKLLAKSEAHHAEAQAAHKKKVAELKAEHEKGTFHTQERAEKAAAKILGA
jgi:anti-sigma28 factor (negative regulator of flagellin synthesis)